MISKRMDSGVGCIRVAGAPAVFHEELMRQHLYFGVRAIQYSCRVNTAHAVRLQDHLTTPAVHETTPVAHTFPAGKSYMCAPRIGLAPALPLRLAVKLEGHPSLCRLPCGNGTPPARLHQHDGAQGAALVAHSEPLQHVRLRQDRRSPLQNLDPLG